jgi:hypothetical protein
VGGRGKEYVIDRTYRPKPVDMPVFAAPGHAAFSGFAPRAFITEIKPPEVLAPAILPVVSHETVIPVMIAHRVKLPPAKRIEIIIPVGCGSLGFTPQEVTADLSDKELEEFMAMAMEFA